MAARLMAEHHLEQAEIEAAGGEAEKDEIGIEDIDDGGGKSYSETWRGILLWGLGHLFRVELIPRGAGKVSAFGRTSDLQTVRYTYAYLANEIENLAQRYWRLLEVPTQSKRATLNDFRKGAAGRLQSRMEKLRKEQDARDRSARETASEGALIVIERNALELAGAWRKFCAATGFKTRTQKTDVRESDATRAGREAGDTMPLSGGQALASEARRLGPVT